MKKYEPIDCNFYDRLEAFAVKKKIVEIVFRENGDFVTTKDVIKDFKIMDRAEHMITTCGLIVRLDSLVSVDGISLHSNQCTNDHG